MSNNIEFLRMFTAEHKIFYWYVSKYGFAAIIAAVLCKINRSFSCYSFLPWRGGEGSRGLLVKFRRMFALLIANEDSYKRARDFQISTSRNSCRTPNCFCKNHMMT